MDKSCPECRGPVESHPSCHTFSKTNDQGDSKWFACWGCNTATRWYCVALEDERDQESDWGCGWNWTAGLNPRNPRAADNDAKKPVWGDAWEEEKMNETLKYVW